MTIEAIYERGVFKPTQPVDFKEGERLQIQVVKRPLPDSEAIARISGATGTPEDAKAAFLSILAIEGPPATDVPFPDATNVAAQHDRYLYGDRSEFARHFPKSDDGTGDGKP